MQYYANVHGSAYAITIPQYSAYKCTITVYNTENKIDECTYFHTKCLCFHPSESIARIHLSWDSPGDHIFGIKWSGGLVTFVDFHCTTGMPEVTGGAENGRAQLVAAPVEDDA